MKTINAIIFSCLLLLFSCSTKEEVAVSQSLALQKEAPQIFNTAEKLVAFVEENDNGFVKVKHINNFTYSAILKPQDYLLAQKRIAQKTDTLTKDDFEDLQYFDLRIKVEDFHKEFIKYDLSSASDYEQRVNYCAFTMQHDIVLLDGKDTLPCVLYHYERAFEVVPYGHFTLAFEPSKNKAATTKTLVFYDQLFNNGIIKFTFPPKLLVKEPTLL